MTEENRGDRCRRADAAPGSCGTRITRELLRRENLAFAGTAGVSDAAGGRRFVPAFREESTGRVELSRFADGAVAPLHVMDGLPGDWIETRNEAGEPVRLKSGVIAGFVRDGRFYTREEAAEVAE